MKKFLFFLVAFAFTNICFAQDVIVKKDGSTILAKVLKITETDVEYKAYDNQDGPTRVVSISSLQGINYQNGQKETFSTRNSGIVTNETATQFSNDHDLMRLYNLKTAADIEKKAKRLKIAGWVVGGTLALTGSIVAGCCNISDGGWKVTGVAGTTIAVTGSVIWAGCFFRAINIEKKTRFSVQTSPIFQQEFNVSKNDRLMVGIDMLKDNSMKNQTLGMGLRYSF